MMLAGRFLHSYSLLIILLIPNNTDLFETSIVYLQED